MATGWSQRRLRSKQSQQKQKNPGKVVVGRSYRQWGGGSSISLEGRYAAVANKWSGRYADTAM